jgi:L-alanine-DL-glutamate epimerase-like enolase superfamily enzyme
MKSARRARSHEVKPDSDLTIVDITAWDVDIPLADRFAIAGGSMSVAQNVFVRVTLSGGAQGYGECAPFPDVSGENRDSTNHAINDLRETLIGQTAAAYRSISSRLREATYDHRAARCGIETAILDAIARALGLPLWTLLGGEPTGCCQTDVTIPILGRHRCAELADQWYQRGFRRLKLKVGAHLESDLETIHAIAKRHPDLDFILDANQGFSEADSVALINAINRHELKVRLLEQPVDKSDLAAMSLLRRRAPFPLCADESVTSLQEAMSVIKADAADVINIKITKCGVVEAMDIAALAHSAGLGVMFGGMVETRLAMSCSLALATACGPIHTLDLDTPLLMSEDPIEGGYSYDGPRISLTDAPGLGLKPRVEPPVG